MRTVNCNHCIVLLLGLLVAGCDSGTLSKDDALAPTDSIAEADSSVSLPDSSADQAPSPDVVGPTQDLGLDAGPSVDGAVTSDSAPIPDGVALPDSVPAPDSGSAPDSAPAPDAAPSPDSAPAPDSALSPDSAPTPDVGPTPDSTPSPDSAPSPDVASGDAAPPLTGAVKAVLMHHSVGFGVYSAGSAGGGGMVGWFGDYNTQNGTNYQLDEIYFPAAVGSGNHPYDYWNIWVQHAGPAPYNGNPTLEVLAQTYDVIIFKHCFFSCFIQPDTGTPDITAHGTASALRLENYKLQYQALKQKLAQFPGKRFIIWTQPVCTQRPDFPQAMAQRAKDWVTWVKTVWDTPGDNIYLWDFNQLETQGGLYAVNINTDPLQCHPGKSFNESVQPHFGTRIVDVIEGRGDTGSLTGQ